MLAVSNFKCIANLTTIHCIARCMIYNLKISLSWGFKNHHDEIVVLMIMMMNILFITITVISMHMPIKTTLASTFIINDYDKHNDVNLRVVTSNTTKTCYRP